MSPGTARPGNVQCGQRRSGEVRRGRLRLAASGDRGPGGERYFGNDGSSGQYYRVELLAVDRGATRRANQIRDLSSLTAIGVVLDSVGVVRTSGTVDNACAGP